MSKFKFITIYPEEEFETPPGQPTGFLIFNNRDKGIMGRISWHSRWRQYEVAFESSYAWTHDCLADVRAFIVDATAKQRAANAGGERTACPKGNHDHT